MPRRPEVPRSRTRTVLCTVLGSMALCATGIPSASASTITGSSGAPQFAAAAGETNVLAVSQAGQALTFDDNNAITAVPAGCTLVAGNATCAPATSMGVTLGDLNDSATFTNVTIAVGVLGEAGNDTIGPVQGNFSGIFSYSVVGGTGDDDLTAGPSTTELDGGPGNDILRGSANPAAVTRVAADMVQDGADQVIGAAGKEIVTYDSRQPGDPVMLSLDDGANDGAPGEGDNLVGAIDEIIGSQASDTITGSARNETLRGGSGNLMSADTLNGLGGNDVLDGFSGNDTLNGGDGDDSLYGGTEADVFNGGAGTDTAYFSYKLNNAASTDQSATLDGMANDGAAGEGDNLAADVENLVTSDGNDTLLGNGAANVLVADAGNDTLDGGAGTDQLFGNAGNDTLNARDGVADGVDCGDGSDVAVVDSIDIVAVNCENVQGAVDSPPTVSFGSPTANQTISGAAAFPVKLNAADDHGVLSVKLTDDGKAVGADSSAPYVIAYQPSGADVGANTLLATAVDGRGQIGTATVIVRVSRFTPQKVSATVTPSRDRSAPYRFRTRGTVSLPPQVTRAQGCRSGRVSIQFTRGRTVISSRRAALRRDCTYTSSSTFSRRRRGRLSVRARFMGNATLAARRAPTRSVRAG